MTDQLNINLAELTTFGVGGNAERLVTVNSSEELETFLNSHGKAPDWVLGYGANTLISDQGLHGVTLRIKSSKIKHEQNVLIADAGVQWDELVVAAAVDGLWGLELMSGIPGGVGAAVFINITAYGQSAGDRIVWVDAWDPATKTTIRFNKEDLAWGYKQSIFQSGPGAGMIILRAAFGLSHSKTTELEYQWAVSVAGELGLDINSLQQRREIIIETRTRTGSMLLPNDKTGKNAGSFFRNPTVTAAQAEEIIKHDESNRTAEQIKKMNKTHGGDSKRVSAAHVMLAAGFKRGQSWGHVKLNDQNLLKLENTGQATAQDIYNVAQEIITTCQQKLGIELQPEAQMLGHFD